MVMHGEKFGPSELILQPEQAKSNSCLAANRASCHPFKEIKENASHLQQRSAAPTRRQLLKAYFTFRSLCSFCAAVAALLRARMGLGRHIRMLKELSVTLCSQGQPCGMLSNFPGGQALLYSRQTYDSQRVRTAPEAVSESIAAKE